MLNAEVVFTGSLADALQKAERNTEVNSLCYGSDTPSILATLL